MFARHKAKGICRPERMANDQSNFYQSSVFWIYDLLEMILAWRSLLLGKATEKVWDNFQTRLLGLQKRSKSSKIEIRVDGDFSIHGRSSILRSSLSKVEHDARYQSIAW